MAHHDNCVRHGQSDDHNLCSHLLQENLHAMEQATGQFTPPDSEQALHSSEQDCPGCHCRALCQHGWLFVERKAYVDAMACFDQAQQLAHACGEHACAHLIAFRRHMCLLLHQVTMADEWLSAQHAHLMQQLTQLNGLLHASMHGTQHGVCDDESQTSFVSAPRLLSSSIDDAAKDMHKVDFYVRCLGAFEFLRHGQPIALPRNRKLNLILKYLVMYHDGPVARATLIDLAWPDAPTALANNSLNTTLSLIRRSLTRALNRSLQGPILLHQDGMYCWHPDVVLQIDTEEFDTYYQRGLAYENAGQQAKAIAAYRAAVALYRGDLLLGDLDDDRTVIGRERLTCTFLTLLNKLADACLMQGQYEEALSYAHRLLEHDPCREDAHRQIMRGLARLGQRVQALRQFELCQSFLRRHLDIEPESETLAMWQRIAQGESV